MFTKQGLKQKRSIFQYPLLVIGKHYRNIYQCMMGNFKRLYDQLHIGLLHDVDIVKDAIKAARTFVEKLEHT